MRLLIKLIIGLSLILFFAQLAMAEPKPFLVDTDMGVDDVIAILYLLNRTDIDIKAITIASTGGAHCAPAWRNARGLLQLMGKSSIPVTCGPDQALTPDVARHHFPESELKESDTLGGTAQLLPLPPLSEKHSQQAVPLLIHTLKQSSQPVTIVAIGPLTNLAAAFLHDPTIKSHIKMIYVMGGALSVPGNIEEVDPRIHNKTAEWNIYLDPKAAAIVFAQGVPITLVPLDVCDHMPIDMNFYHTLQNQHQALAADYVFKLLTSNLKMLQDKEWYFWDPLAAVIATDESLAAFSLQPVKVVISPENESGTTRISPGFPTLRIVTGVHKDQFEKLLLSTLNKKMH